MLTRDLLAVANLLLSKVSSAELCAAVFFSFKYRYSFTLTLTFSLSFYF